MDKFKIARTHNRSMKLNKGSCYSSWRLIHENFKKLDKFGHPITLTYKGRDKFQTPWGACMSVLVCLTMTWVILIMVSQIVTQPFQSRSVMTTLIDSNYNNEPETSIEDSDPSLIERYEAKQREGEIPIKKGDPLVIPADVLTGLLSIINLETFSQKEVTVSKGLFQKNEALFTEGKDVVFSQCLDGKGCRLAINDPVDLYEPQIEYPFNTWTDFYDDTDLMAIYFEPCFDEESFISRCSDKSTIFEKLRTHNLRLRYQKKDDRDNSYWVETPLPKVGNAMSVYIRQITTIDEDYHYLFGYAFLGLFSDNLETPGVTKKFSIGSIISDHQPALNRPQAKFSSTLYIRQDPLQETIYVRRYNVLYMLAQLVGALTLLNFLGLLFTSFWTNRLYNASMIKHLYKVKHTSAGRNHKSVPVSKYAPSEENKDNPGQKVSDADQKTLQSSGQKISDLWERMDAVKQKRLRANIISWKQIDKQDIKNLLTSLLNRSRLSLSSAQIFVRLFCCCCRRTNRHNRYQRLYTHGEKRLQEKELDVYKIVQSARRSKLLSRTLLNQRQQLLLKFQKYEMLDTEESSSESDADWSKLESKNPFLRLMALGRAKNTMGQYLLHDIDGLDVKLLFGVYQRKVLGHEERPIEEFEDILEKILLSKKQAKQIYKQNPNRKYDSLPGSNLDEARPEEQPQNKSPKPKLVVDKYAKNDSMLRAGQKSYLAQFTIQPSYQVDQSIATQINPTPPLALDVGQAEYFESNAMGSQSPRLLHEQHQSEYNMNFEPNASKYDNKVVIDHDANGEVIGMMSPRRRSMNHSEANNKERQDDTIDVKFEFQGPRRRTSNERHYFKTINEQYRKKIGSKKTSLSDLIEPPRRHD